MAEDRSVSSPVLVVVVACTIAAILAALIWVERRESSPAFSNPVFGEEEKAYLRQVAVTDARMSAVQNFLGDTVIYLDARVTNRGGKFVRKLEIELKFVDVLNQVVLLEKARPVSDLTSLLKPGESRPFRVTLERLPRDWNRAPPTITPTRVNF